MSAVCGRATKKTAQIVRRGGVVAYPTESCFGFGCAPGCRRAVLRLLRLKRRSQSKGLILIAARPGMLAHFADVPPKVRDSWPGPYTWLVAPKHRTRRWIRGVHGQVAVRVPDHPGAAALSRAAGMPVVSTSANRSGSRPARSAREVRRRFGRQLDAIDPGPIGGRRFSSTIIDAGSGRVIRGNGT